MFWSLVWTVSESLASPFYAFLKAIQVIQTIEYFNATEYFNGDGGGQSTTSLFDCLKQSALSTLLGVGRSLLTPRISLEVRLAGNISRVVLSQGLQLIEILAKLRLSEKFREKHRQHIGGWVTFVEVEREFRLTELNRLAIRLHFMWQLQRCNQDIKQAIQWLKDLTNTMLSRSSEIGESAEEADGLFLQHIQFQEAGKCCSATLGSIPIRRSRRPVPGRPRATTPAEDRFLALSARRRRTTCAAARCRPLSSIRKKNLRYYGAKSSSQCRSVCKKTSCVRLGTAYAGQENMFLGRSKMGFCAACPDLQWK
ncbi:uncharacterized protein TNCV_406001 [Trichonephila clavipes]|nr:uncharacterized protein TNCV_406001 [Trichonephila clavipes]